MNIKEQPFYKKILGTFRAESEERITAISLKLIELEKGPETIKKEEIIEQLYREFHSLKGASRSVDLEEVANLCHSTETLFSLLKNKELDPSRELIEIVFSVVDCINELIHAETQEKSTNARNSAGKLKEILDQASTGIIIPVESATGTLPGSEKTGGAVKHPAKESAVRVPLLLLDSLMNQIEELRSVKLMAHQHLLDLNELKEAFSSHQAAAEKSQQMARFLRQLPKRNGAINGNETYLSATNRLLESVEENQDFLKSCFHKILHLSNVYGNYTQNIDSLVNNLQEEIKKLLMLPFSSLLQSLPKLVRDLSHEQGKKVSLTIQGAEVEIDRRILDEIRDPLVHLIRNSIDHGVESPADRKKKKKAPEASLTITVTQKSSKDVELSIGDDGAGMDPRKVREAVVRSKAAPPEKLKNLPDANLLPYIFSSGVSTKSIITDVSGRGLGLAIAREKIEKLGGTITFETKEDIGTTFRVTLPLTLSSFRGVLVKANDQNYIIPSSCIERVLAVGDELIRSAENRETIEAGDEVISLVHLSDIVENPKKKQQVSTSGPMLILVLFASGTRVAFQVDEISGEQEVLVKNLGKQMQRIRNVMGATILANGEVVPVLDAMDLLKSSATISTTGMIRDDGGARKPEKKKRVLVAEDSITARSLLKNILELEGYNVNTAVNGIDAYNQLLAGEFDLLVSDVDMPKMNGFLLTEKVRNHKELSKLPVILVTALESSEDKERGIDAGASAYIVKRSFDQDNLLEIVKRLI